MVRGNPVSEIVWLVWLVFGIAWEMVGISSLGARYGIEPLTRIVRDRLFASRFGEAAIAVFLAFMAWLVWHWTVKRGPNGEIPGTAQRDDYDDEDARP